MKRDLSAASIDEFVERVVANAPPLTDEQLSDISSVLLPVPKRAIDDPVELAKAGRIMRAAQQREDRIRKIVDAAPPLTAPQRERLALLLAPTGDREAERAKAKEARRTAERERLRAHAREVAAGLGPLSDEQKDILRGVLTPVVTRLEAEEAARLAKEEEEARRASVRKGLARKRKSEAAIAAEVIAERLARRSTDRTQPADPLVSLALEIQEKTGLEWADAYANAEAIAAWRRIKGGSA